MSALPITITTAGLNALVNAQNTGVSNVVIASLGVSPTQIAATAATTAIPGEVKRIAGVAGQVVADDQIYISAADQTEDTYVVRTIGLYLDTGVLFAVYSQALPLLEKAGPAMAVLEAAIKLSSPQADAIEFSGGGWLNPQASETVQGVLRLATEAEAKAGTNTTRAVTPKGLKGAIDVVVTWINQELNGIAQALAGKAAAAHTHVMGDITGLVAALNGKAAAAHTHVMGDIIGLVDALNGKAAAIHTHAMSSIDGLTNALAGKAAAAHTHVMGEISGLAEALGSKAAAAHTHVMSEITGLIAALGAKATLGESVTFQDVRAFRGNGTGVVVLGDAAHYLYYDGFNYSLTGAPLIVNGGSVWTAANFDPSDKVSIYQTNLGRTGGGPVVKMNTFQDYGDVATGWSAMLHPDSAYAPGGWGYFMKAGRRDNGNGWGGLFFGRVTEANTKPDLWVGMAITRDHQPYWAKLWSDANFDPGSKITIVNTDGNAHTMVMGWSGARFVATVDGLVSHSFLHTADAASSLGASGYAMIPGTGLMMQWGVVYGSIPEGFTQATLPTAFGGGCLVAMAIPRNAGGVVTADWYMQMGGKYQDRLVFYANRANGGTGSMDGFEWLAIGRVSGAPDPAYSSGGGGGGGGGGGEIDPYV